MARNAGGSGIGPMDPTIGKVTSAKNPWKWANRFDFRACMSNARWGEAGPIRSLKGDRPGFAGRAVGGGRSPPPS